jgi:methylmalonyl-CoA mutase cobalamin-binding subunit
MRSIGSSWQDGSLRVVHEHLASAVVRSLLGALSVPLPMLEGAPSILLTTPAGQLHELGALMAAITAADEGWKPVYAGPSLPVEEIVAGATELDVRVVALSIVYPQDDPLMGRELTRLGRLLPEGVVLIVGGRAASSYETALQEAGAKYVEDLSGFREALREIRG